VEKPEELAKPGKYEFSDIEQIETDLERYSDEEEKFMSPCQDCLQKWQEGKLEDVEGRWISEKNRIDYVELSR